MSILNEVNKNPNGFNERFREEIKYIKEINDMINKVEVECKWSEVDEVVEYFEAREFRFFEYNFNMDEDICSFDLYLKNVVSEDGEEPKSEYIRSWILSLSPSELDFDKQSRLELV